MKPYSRANLLPQVILFRIILSELYFRDLYFRALSLLFVLSFSQPLNFSSLFPSLCYETLTGARRRSNRGMSSGQRLDHYMLTGGTTLGRVVCSALRYVVSTVTCRTVGPCWGGS